MPEIQAVLNTKQAQANLDKLIAGFRDLANEAAKSGQVLDGALGDSKGIQATAAATGDLGKQGKSTFAILGGLKRLIPTIATGAAVAGVVNYGNAWNLVQRSVALAVQDTSQAATVTGQLADIARDAGVGVQGVADTFQRFSLATQDLNLSQAETIGLVDTITRGFALFSSSSAEAASASTQLSQALAKGRLDGDELRSVLESFPPLARAIADTLGVTVGELRDLGAAGAITSSVLVEAIDNLGGSLDALEARVDRTVGQAFAALGTSITEIVGNFDEAIGASSLFVGAVDLLSDGIADLNDAIFDVPPTAEELADAIADSAVNLARLDAEMQRATGAAGAFSTAFGENTAQTAAFNRALDEHQELLALQARQTALSTIANRELGDSVGFTTIAFRDVTNELTGYRAEAAEAARFAALAALANQDLSDSVDEAGINYKTLTDNTRAAALATERSEAAAKADAAARQAQAEGLRQFNEDLKDQIELFGQAEQARREAFDEAFDEQAELFEKIRQVNEEALGGIAETLGEIFGTSAGVVGDFFANFDQLLTDLGFKFGDTFAGISTAIADALGIGIRELDGFFGLAVEGLDILGIEFEDIFGKKLTGIIERFAGLSTNEIGALGDIIGGVAGVIGGIFNPQVDAAANSFGALGFAANDALGGLGGQISGLIDDLFGLNDNIAGTSQAVGGLGQQLAIAAGQAGLFAGAAAGITSFLGGGQRAQQFSALGAAIGSLGGPITAVIGGAAGGIIGRLFGDGDRIDPIRLAANQLFADFQRGVQITADQIRQQFGDQAPAIINTLNELIEGLSVNASNLINGIGEQTVNVVGGVVGAVGQLAGTFAQTFQVAATDVISVLQTLPPEFIQSFSALDENARAVAQRLAEVFGVSVEEVIALIERLQQQFNARLGNISEGSRFLALSLSEVFGVSVEQITQALDRLPPEAFSSFDAIRANADLIARNLAVLFGTSADEIIQALRGILGEGNRVFGGIGEAAGQAAGSVEASIAGAAAGASSSLSQLGGNAGEILNAIAGNAGNTAGQISNSFAGAAANVRGSLSSITGEAAGTFDRVAALAGSSAGRIASSFGAAAGAASGAIASIRRAAEGASAAVRSIPRVPSASRLIPERFATGGIITGPVQLASASPFGQSGFRTGGVLPGLTGIASNDNNLVGPFKAVAGEAGTEAILPLTQTSDGLGVTAKIGGGGNVTKIIFIEGVDRAETDRIKRRLFDTDASIETRARNAAVDVLLGAA